MFSLTPWSLKTASAFGVPFSRTCSILPAIPISSEYLLQTISLFSALKKTGCRKLRYPPPLTNLHPFIFNASFMYTRKPLIYNRVCETLFITMKIEVKPPGYEVSSTT